MTTDQKVARRKLSMLQLASELNNVSKACRPMGYSRQQFYDIRRNYQTYGAHGLIDRPPGARGPHHNRVPPEVEQAIFDDIGAVLIIGLLYGDDLAPYPVAVAAAAAIGLAALNAARVGRALPYGALGLVLWVAMLKSGVEAALAGIMGATWLAVRFKIGALPRGVGWQHLYGVALLAGIGFTMSLFIASLAFAEPSVRGGAKLAIVLGSLLSAMAGIGWLSIARRPPRTAAWQGYGHASSLASAHSISRANTSTHDVALALVVHPALIRFTQDLPSNSDR